MNGPQHYTTAERLLSSVNASDDDPRDTLIIAQAQVHATLALTAATIAAADRDNLFSTAPAITDAWWKATS